MLGNDQRWGDCVFAGACHETMLWTAEGGEEARPVLRRDSPPDYAAVTGFNPDDPSTDQGTNVRDALAYRQKTGIRRRLRPAPQDRRLRRARPGDLNAHPRGDLPVRRGRVSGPSSRSRRWTSSTPGSRGRRPGFTDRGRPLHPVGGERRRLECVTWGRIQRSARVPEPSSDEAWGSLSLEALNSGKSPQGFDLAGLKADLQALKG
jgi:hypothetical protein